VPNGSWDVSTPAVADGVAVFDTRDGSVNAIRTSSGRRIWEIQVADGVVASPAIHRGRAFVPSLDGHLYALRLTDGAIPWKRNLGGLAHSSPTVMGESLIVAGGYPLRQLFRINAATGASIWETAPEVMAQFSNSAAVCDGDQVLIGAMGGRLYSFDLTTGAHRWTYQADATINLSAPVIVGGRAYLLPGGDSRRLHALADRKAVPGWPVDLPGPADTTEANVTGKLLERSFAVSSLTVAAGRLVIDVRTDDLLDTNADGAADQFSMREWLISPAPSDGHVSWQKDNGRRVVASLNETPKNWLCPTPAAYQDPKTRGSLLAAASSLVPAVHVLDAASGALLPTVALVAPSRISPVLANGRLIVGGESGVIQGKLSSSNQPPDPPSLTGGALRSIGTRGAKIHWAAALDPEGDSISSQVRADRDGDGAGCFMSGQAGAGAGGTATASEMISVLAALGGLALLAGAARRRSRRRWTAALGFAVVATVAAQSPALANACVWNSSSTANWSASGSWTSCGGTTPQAGDTVTFNSSKLGSCTVDANVTVTSITVSTGFTGTVTQSSTRTITTSGIFSQAAGTFAGNNADINVGGNFSLSGTASFTSTSTILTIGGTFTETGSANFVHHSGTVVMTSTAASNTFASNGETFNHLVINDGLIGYWKLDDAASPSVDSSGNGNDAAWASTPVASATVPTLNFANPRSLGIDSAADYAAFPSSSATVVTIAVWVKATAAGGGCCARILDMPGYQVYFNTGSTPPDNPMSLSFVSVRSTTNSDWKTPSNSVSFGSWYHFAVTYDSTSTSNLPKFYVNGALVATTVQGTPAGTQLSNVGTGYIGNRAAADRYFNGLIDDLRIYNRALSATEIAALGAGNQPGSSVATHTMTGDPIIAGDLVIASGTLAGGNTAISVAGNWWNYGGLFTTGATGSVTFNGSTSGKSIRASQSDFNTVNIAGTGSWNLVDTTSVEIDKDLTISAGTLTSTPGILEVQGAFNKTGGTFTHNSGTVLLSSTTSQTFASNGATFDNLVINDGLIGYWKLDDAASPSLDSSGHGNDATWAGTPVASATVPSVNFANPRSLGIDSAADYAAFASPATTVVTIAAWVKATAAGGGCCARIVDMPGYEVYFNTGSTAPDNPMSLSFVSVRSTANSDWKTPSNSASFGSWYHFAVTYDSASTSNLPTFYVNGALVATTVQAAPSGTQPSNAGTGYIGNRAAADRYFNGLIDDLRIYNRALSASEINSLYIGNQTGTGLGTQTLTGNPTIAGDLVIASGTLAAGTNTVTVAGNWFNNGGFYTTGTSGSVVFNGSAATNKILSGGSIFQNVSVTGSGTWTLADRMEIDPARSLTMTAGALSLSSYKLRAGDVSRNGAITITPSTGTVVLDASASQTLDTGTFYNVRIEPVAATNLVGYWKLDTGQGVTVKDYSGNGNDGTLTNGPTWVNAGLPSAITFDNPAAVTFSGASSQYVRTASLPPVLQPTTLTMSAWYKATSVDTGGAEVVSGSDRYALRVVSNTVINVRKRTGASTWVTLAGTVANALDGSWHHVAGVISPSGMLVYFDGNAVSSNADSTAIDYSSPGSFNIGRDPDNTSYDFTGTIDDVRVYNTALIAAQINALASGTYPAGLAGTPIYTLGYATTVSGALSIDNGTLATSSFTLSAASAGGSAATVNSGTYSVGSATNTFPGGLTVNANGTLDLPTSGGVVEIGTSAQTQVLTIDGTLSAASTGAIIRKVTGANNFTFKVGSSASATPTVNITGLQVKNTDTNGMYINAVSGSTTTFTRFDNIAFSAGTGARLLQIYAPSLYLVSNGCSFDSGASSGTTTKNVTLRGDGSATETRAVFGGATCLNGSNPTYALCEASDDDDDANNDGIGDTTASNAAVIQWTHAAMADTSGTLEGFPTAAFDWNTFTYYSTYVLYHDVAGGTADRIYVRNTNGTALYSWDSPSGVDLVGTPRFDTVSSVHYVYVATSSGKVYRLIDNGTSSLTQDLSGSWSSGAYDCTCTITTPLTIDSSNIYWGGTASGNNKIWTLGKTSRALAASSPLTVTAVVSGAAPAVWISGDTYVMMGTTAHIYKVDATTQTLTTDNSTLTGTVSGRLSIINSKVYAADSAGSLLVVDPASFGTTSWSYHDNGNHSGCAAGSTCAIGSLYVDPALSRAFYGDGDGHLYSSYNSSGTTGAQSTGFPYRPGSSSEVYGSAPLYRLGILVAGTTTGNVYFIDANGGSGPVLKQTYKFGSSTKVSGIAYDNSSSSYMISTSNAASKDGKLIYVDAMTDPTPGSI